MQNNKHIALYIHWPFCLSKCPYCDFNSYQGLAVDEKAWQDALLLHLDYSFKNFAQGYKISSIFFGGGTPSLMPPVIVDKILEASYKHGVTNKNIEVTLETNPRTVNKTKLLAFKSAGINRISLGVQSFLDKNLEFLKRDHEVKNSYETIENVKTIFNNFSFDIIYGLKNQTLQSLHHELNNIKQLEPPHVSFYQLTIEENTPFYRQNVKETCDSLSIAMHTTIKNFLGSQNILQYEVSNYAKKGFECKHNLNYWHGVPYIGIGAGACGRVILNNNWFESRCFKNPNNYLKNVLSNKNGFEVFEKISNSSRFEEEFLSYIRLNSGIPPELQNKLTKTQTLKVKELIENNFLQLLNNNLVFTKKGMFYINSIIKHIFT